MTITAIDKFITTKVEQFDKLTDAYKARVIAKTVLIAAAVGLVSGIIAGPIATIIAFAVTAGYVSTSTLDRITSSTAFKKIFGDLKNNVKNEAQDLTKSVTRTAEDLFDSLVGTTKKENQKKIEARKVEDVETGILRMLANAFREIQFTLAL